MPWMAPEKHPVDEKVLGEVRQCACLSADTALFADYEAYQAMTGAEQTRLVMEAGIRGLVENGVIELPSWEELQVRLKDGYAIGG